MKKKNIFIIIVILLFFSVNVKAITQEELYQKLDKLPFKIVDGKRYIEVNAVDPDKVIGDSCTFTEEDYNEEYLKNYDETAGIPKISFEDWNIDRVAMCKSEYYSSYVSTYLSGIGYGQQTYEYGVTAKDVDGKASKTLFEFGATDNEDDGYASYEVEVSYIAEYDENEYQKAAAVANKLEEVYSIFGLNIINSIYHYGLNSRSAYASENILPRYSDLKELIENNPEYKFIPSIMGAGGAPYYGRYYLQVGLFKNDVMYAVQNVTFDEYSIMYVDKDETGTIFEKAEKRLKEYFNNKVDVVVDGTDSWINEGEEFDQIVNNNLGTTNVTYKGHVAKILIGEDIETYFVIVEIPKDKLDKAVVKSFDVETGVNVETESYDVPLDVKLNAKDVKEEKFVKDALNKKNLKVDLAYDLTLSKSHDNTFINTIENGIEVYIPVSNDYKVGDKEKVYYIKEDTAETEVFDGEVVSINDKTYIKFITTHFSTYALASNVIENPNTLDNIGISFITMFISLVGIISGLIYVKKNSKN